MTRRREFIIQVSAGSAALLAGRFAMAADMVAETDAQATAMGYKADTSKVDAKKFPTHKASQNCGNCALFQGKARLLWRDALKRVPCATPAKH